MEVGVVGVGYWGPNLVRVLFELGHQVTICDIDPEKVEEVIFTYGDGVVGTCDYRALLNSPVEAVCLATPIKTHYRMALQALEANKHVFVEKPMASGPALALFLAKVAVERNLCLLPGHTFLWSPPVRHIKMLIDQGELGDIYSISMQRRNIDTWRSDASVIQDLAPHDFSILRYWLDAMPEQIGVIQRATNKQPDTAFCNLVFPGDIIVSVELGWLSPIRLRSTTIVGSKAMLTYDDCALNKVHLHRPGGPPDGIVIPTPPPTEPVKAMLKDFIACCEGDRHHWATKIGIDTVRMITMAEDAWRY